MVHSGTGAFAQGAAPVQVRVKLSEAEIDAYPALEQPLMPRAPRIQSAGAVLLEAQRGPTLCAYWPTP